MCFKKKLVSKKISLVHKKILNVNKLLKKVMRGKTIREGDVTWCAFLACNRKFLFE